MQERIITKTAAFLVVLMAFWGGAEVSAAGHAPEFRAISNPTIYEGETLTVELRATDSDSEPLVINMVTRPLGASLSDHGNGTATFVWNAAFDGPNSSLGSPFEVTFRVSDGTLSDLTTMKITVLNNNRKPVIDPVGEIDFMAGDLVAFNLSGADPDNDPLSWRILEGPEGLTLDGTGRASQVTWDSEYADSGSFAVKMALSDIYGASDTADFAITLEGQTVYALTVGEATGYPTEMVDVDVYLDNLEPISGLNLLVHYDVSALILGAISEAGTRIEDFEYFTYYLNYLNQPGHIKVIAIADKNNPSVTLAPGYGSILTMRYAITSDYNYSGFAIPIQFAFEDIFTLNDNTLTDPNGAKIPQEAIVYDNGSVLIKIADVNSVGDINLNGVNFEISDVVYYTNFYIYPSGYPLNAEQRANADVNRDGVSPSIADLVYMIHYIVNRGTTSAKPRYFGNPAAVAVQNRDGVFSFAYESGVEIGGLAVTVVSGDTELAEQDIVSTMEQNGMTVKKSVENGTVRLIAYSDSGRHLDGGVNEFLKIKSNANINLVDFQLSTIEGALIPVTLKDEGILPEGFRLYQNYPNPFNPVTEIRFVVPVDSKVELTVFNVLGQQIRSLASGRLPAGSHTVTWDGTDDEGTPVSSGIYFYRLSAGEYQDRKKMVLLK